jgi:ParB/RepB/Spo0J family partition protein
MLKENHMAPAALSHAKLLHIPLASLIVAPQVRTKMEKEALAELAEDMRTNGVLEPILVRPAGHSKYRIIAGHRRAAAATLAELTTVPAMLRNATDEEAMMMQLSENIHREDLSTKDLANAIRRLFDGLGSLDAVAAFTMKSKPWCSKHLTMTLPNYSWRALKLIEDGVTEDLEIIGIVHQVDELCRWPHNTEAVQQLIDLIVNEHYTRDQCRAYVKELKTQHAAQAELNAAKAKVAAAKSSPKAKKWKADQALKDLWFAQYSVEDDQTDDEHPVLDALAEHSPEQLAEMHQLLKTTYDNGAAIAKGSPLDIYIATGRLLRKRQLDYLNMDAYVMALAHVPCPENVKDFMELVGRSMIDEKPQPATLVEVLAPAEKK